jgi:hypothetical protein
MSDAMNEGLPVAGYRPQTDEAVDLVNENKLIEERLLRRLEALRTLAIAAEDGGNSHLIDFRWFSVARTHFEQGFMALNRSIFQPGRIALPGDDVRPPE